MTEDKPDFTFTLHGEPPPSLLELIAAHRALRRAFPEETTGVCDCEARDAAPSDDWVPFVSIDMVTQTVELQWTEEDHPLCMSAAMAEYIGTMLIANARGLRSLLKEEWGR